MKGMVQVITGIAGVSIASALAFISLRQFKETKIKRIIHAESIKSINAFNAFLKTNSLEKGDFYYVSDSALTPIYAFHNAKCDPDSWVPPQNYEILKVTRPSKTVTYAVSEKLPIPSDDLFSNYHILFFLDPDTDWADYYDDNTETIEKPNTNRVNNAKTSKC